MRVFVILEHIPNEESKVKSVSTQYNSARFYQRIYNIKNEGLGQLEIVETEMED